MAPSQYAGFGLRPTNGPCFQLQVRGCRGVLWQPLQFILAQAIDLPEQAQCARRIKFEFLSLECMQIFPVNLLKFRGSQMLADGRFLNLSDSLVIAIAIQSTLLLQLSIKLT